MSYIVHLNAPNEDPQRVRRRYLSPQRRRCLIVHVAWHERNPSNLRPPGYGIQLKYLQTPRDLNRKQMSRAEKHLKTITADSEHRDSGVWALARRDFTIQPRALFLYQFLSFLFLLLMGLKRLIHHRRPQTERSPQYNCLCSSSSLLSKSQQTVYGVKM